MVGIGFLTRHNSEKNPSDSESAALTTSIQEWVRAFDEGDTAAFRASYCAAQRASVQDRWVRGPDDGPAEYSIDSTVVGFDKAAADMSSNYGIFSDVQFVVMEDGAWKVCNLS